MVLTSRRCRPPKAADRTGPPTGPGFRAAWRAFGGRMAALAAVSGLAACAVTVDVPMPGAGAPGQTQSASPSAAPSAESQRLTRKFARVEGNLRAQGLLRTDGGGPDTPFNARTLTREFLRIALYDEYTPVGGSMVQRVTASRLRRWEEPVRIGMEFGASVPEALRGEDRARVADYAARLSRAADHPVRMAGPGETANFHVLVLNEDERRAGADRLRRLLPGIGDGPVRTITALNENTFCLVFAFSSGGGHSYSRAVAVVRAEHPDLMRLACYQEEIAQGLGLANDSPSARPSIFNDDEEFALLTRMDEMMLRILYDDRLRPGMTEAEARPIVETIAAGLTGGEG